MSRFTDYDALSVPEDDDVLAIVDVSDTTQNAAGSTKKVTVADLTAAAVDAAEAASVPVGSAPDGAVIPKVVTLAQSGGSVAVDASLGNAFTLTLTASGWTISTPSNPADGQVIRFRLAQDGTGSRTVSWGTGYDWGSTAGSANSAPALTTTASKTDYLAFEYDAAISKWVSLGAAFPQGY